MVAFPPILRLYRLRGLNPAIRSCCYHSPDCKVLEGQKAVEGMAGARVDVMKRLLQTGREVNRKRMSTTAWADEQPSQRELD